MVIENEKVMYKNVVSHTYYIHYQQFELALDDFNEKLTKAKCTVKGPLFYGLHNMPTDEKMLVELFMPIEQSYIEDPGELVFQSYFHLDNMLMTRVKGKFEINTEFSYEDILMHAVEQNYLLTSPMYHIFKGDEDLHWVELKMKVKPDGE